MRPETKQAETTTAPLLKSALAQLRRGGPLIVRDGTRCALMRAAESVDAAGLRDWQAMIPAEADTVLVTTHRRAHALALVSDPVATGLWSIALPKETQPALIAALTDPTLVQEVPLPAVTPVPLDADPVATVGIGLLKQAGLLPSLMMATLAHDAAPTLAEAAHLLTLDAGTTLEALTALPRTLTRITDARVPLADAENARIVAFRPAHGGTEHLAIIIGDPPTDAPVLTRIHSECFTGDLLGSLRCDCGEQLRGAIRTMADAGGGIVLYLAQEGRGIGLVNKLRAYRLQDAGFDTVDANEQLGFDPDERVYGPAADMLRQLGYGAVRLLTNNPEKLAALPRHGIAVIERVPHQFNANSHNQHYLETKAKRSGHLF